MPLWGKAAAGTQAQKPKWLSTDENSKYKRGDCYCFHWDCVRSRRSKKKIYSRDGCLALIWQNNQFISNNSSPNRTNFINIIARS